MGSFQTFISHLFWMKLAAAGLFRHKNGDRIYWYVVIGGELCSLVWASYNNLDYDTLVDENGKFKKDFMYSLIYSLGGCNTVLSLIDFLKAFVYVLQPAHVPVIINGMTFVIRENVHHISRRDFAVAVFLNLPAFIFNWRTLLKEIDSFEKGMDKSSDIDKLNEHNKNTPFHFVYHGKNIVAFLFGAGVATLSCLPSLLWKPSAK